MSTYSDIESLMSQASTALAEGDYTSAETLGIRAQGLLSVLPIDARKEGYASGSIRYSESMIGDFLDRVRKLIARNSRKSNLGIFSNPVKLKTGNCGDNYDGGCC